MSIKQGAEGFGKVAEWIHVSHLAVGDEADEQGPVLGSYLVPCEDGVLSCQGDLSDLVLDGAVVELQPAVLQEPSPARPAHERAADVFGQLSEIAGRFAPFVQPDGSRILILPEGRPLTRIIASVFDQHLPEGVRYSRAS